MSCVRSLAVLALLTTLFIATNLSIGYTFSTVAGNQLQAMQMVMMFILPNILLSGFMFPFAGMPAWARAIGEALPLTHFLRIVRGVTLKGADLYDLRIEALALAGIMVIAMAVGCLFNSFLLDHTEALFYAWLSGLLYAGLRPASVRAQPAASVQSP